MADHRADDPGTGGSVPAVIGREKNGKKEEGISVLLKFQKLLLISEYSFSSVLCMLLHPPPSQKLFYLYVSADTQT